MFIEFGLYEIFVGRNRFNILFEGSFEIKCNVF